MNRQLAAVAAVIGTIAFSNSAIAAVMKVGTFSKTTAAQPAAQSIPHNLGTTPKLIWMWTVGTLADNTPGLISAFGMGLSDGTLSRTLAGGSFTDGSPMHSGRAIYDKALATVSVNGALRTAAQIDSWDKNQFNITWTTNNATADRIQFIAIGGADVSAQLIDWNFPAVTGIKNVTGLSFQPDVVLHFHVGDTFTAGHNTGDTTAMVMGLGASSAVGEWESVFYVMNGTATSGGSDQGTSSVMSLSGTTSVAQASFNSMLSNGFSLNFSAVQSQGSIFSLALAGVHADTTHIGKAVPMGTQEVINLGFQPELFVINSVVGNSPDPVSPPVSWVFGAADGTNQVCISAAPDATFSSPNEVYDAIDNTPATVAPSPVNASFGVNQVILDSDLKHFDDFNYLALASVASCGTCDDGGTGASTDAGATDGGVTVLPDGGILLPDGGMGILLPDGGIGELLPDGGTADLSRSKLLVGCGGCQSAPAVHLTLALLLGLWMTRTVLKSRP